MENKINKIITLNGNKYIVVDQGIYRKRNFLLINKLNNDDLTDDISIVEEMEDSVIDVDDEKVLSTLKEYFTRRIKNWVE